MTQPIYPPAIPVAGDFARSVWMNRNYTIMRTAAFLLMAFVAANVSAQQNQPTTGYAPVNGVNMYYEIHGSGEPVVLLHGAFMTITNNWGGWIERALQNAESDCRRNAGSRPHGGRRARYHLRKPRRRRGCTARLSQDPASGPYRLQHGRSRGDAVCDPPSGQSAKGSHHFVHVPQ